MLKGVELHVNDRLDIHAGGLRLVDVHRLNQVVALPREIGLSLKLFW